MNAARMPEASKQSEELPSVFRSRMAMTAASIADAPENR
jgi:hypothetical protein